jgi:hypothetical protein
MTEVLPWIQLRNDWIKANTSQYIPLDEMANDGAYGRDVEDGKHFQCQFLNAFGQSPNNGAFKSPPGRDCADLINLNALMEILHITGRQAMLVAHRSAGGENRSLFRFDSDNWPFLTDYETNGSFESPFMTNFDKCYSSGDPPVVPAEQYGPMSTTRKIVVLEGHHPVIEMQSLLLEQASNFHLPSRDAFASVVHNLARAQPIIMHVFMSEYGGAGVVAGRDGYYPMIQSWFTHVSRVGLTDHVLFVAKNVSECAYVARWAPCLVDTRKLGFPEPMHDYAQNFRWIYAHLLLQSNLSVIMTDSDAFILQDPLPFLEKCKDVAGLTDTLYDGTFPMDYCNEPPLVSPCQSTGFTYMRPTQLVQDTVQEFTFAFSGGFEQALWNPFAVKLVKAGVYTTLPSKGELAFANWNVVKPSIEHNESINVAVLHMGGEQGGGGKHWMDKKTNIFLCTQLLTLHNAA